MTKYLTAAMCSIVLTALPLVFIQDAPPPDPQRDRPPTARPDGDHPAPPPLRPGAGSPSEGDQDDRAEEGRRRWDARRGPWVVTPEQRANIIAVIQDLQSEPLTEEHLRKLNDAAPEEFLRIFQENAGTILSLARLREQESDLYRLRVEDFRLMRRARELGRLIRQHREQRQPEQAGTLEQELRRIVARQIDLELEGREVELRLLEARLAAMSRELAERRERKEMLIAQRLQRLLEAEEGPPPPRPAPREMR